MIVLAGHSRLPAGVVRRFMVLTGAVRERSDATPVPIPK